MLETLPLYVHTLVGMTLGRLLTCTYAAALGISPKTKIHNYSSTHPELTERKSFTFLFHFLANTSINDKKHK